MRLAEISIHDLLQRVPSVVGSALVPVSSQKWSAVASLYHQSCPPQVYFFQVPLMGESELEAVTEDAEELDGAACGARGACRFAGSRA